MGAPGYAPVAAMRGDFGSRDVKTRDMKTKLKFAKYLLNCDSLIIKEMFKDTIMWKSAKLMKKMMEYMDHLDIDVLKDMTDGALECKMNLYANRNGENKYLIKSNPENIL